MQSYNHDNETKLNFKMKGMGFFYYNVETELNQLVISNMLTNQKHKPIRQNSMLKSWNVNTYTDGLFIRTFNAYLLCYQRLKHADLLQGRPLS